MNWRTHVQFRDLLENYDEDADDELKEISRVKPLWIERFNQFAVLKRFVSGLDKVKTQSQFNRWLNRVYDYCDDNGIFVDF